ncbi:MAG: hypothetical protein NT149_03370 [Candidatus Gottesmanbacteria bacterium]|nr:hypothetical protein [Candidatus Gottesmanbacteria bacterium]
MKHHTKHHYRNIILVCIGIGAAILLSRNGAFRAALLHLGTFGYIGAFLTGMLFVTTFTAPIGTLMLIILAQRYSAVEIGLIAGAGAVLSDALIFRFVRDDLSDEIKSLYKHFGGSHLRHIFHSKYFHWTLPVIGALIIASPLPDELGVSLLGISKMKPFQFVFTSFCMNSLGIFLIVSTSALFTS